MNTHQFKFFFIGILLLSSFRSVYSQNKPNVILIFPDNIGVGEVNSYGGVRGVPTPNIDKIGNEGIRLTNFNVEYSCTPSRIALLTGRYAARAGDATRSGVDFCVRHGRFRWSANELSSTVRVGKKCSCHSHHAFWGQGKGPTWIDTT